MTALNFLFEAQSHSGLPLINSNSIKYCQSIYITALAGDLLNDYMIDIHKMYRKNKTWKSYDW